MSVYKGYDPKSAVATNKYISTHKEKLNLLLPIGTKAKWRKKAEKAGDKSLTAYIIRLVEQDI